MSLITPNPITPRRLVDLYFRPRRYFANLEPLSNSFIITLCAFVLGIAYSIDRIASQIAMMAVLINIPPIDELYGLLTNGWLYFWQTNLTSGVLTGAIVYYGGGWWYHVRLRWAGAKEADMALARRIYTMQEFVACAPLVALGVAHTFMYTNYVQAAQSNEIWMTVSLFFTLWSCWISYAAATTTYPLILFKARLLFLILPIIICTSMSYMQLRFIHFIQGMSPI